MQLLPGTTADEEGTVGAVATVAAVATRAHLLFVAGKGVQRVCWSVCSSLNDFVGWTCQCMGKKKERRSSVKPRLRTFPELVTVGYGIEG